MTPETHAAWIVAVVAGVMSFISPCVLPLIPGYLSMISGLSLEQLEGPKSKHVVRIFFSCLLFAAGFSVVFILLGASAGVVGRWLRHHMTIFNIASGVLIVIFGLFITNVIKLPFLYRDQRFRLQRGAVGLWAAPILGFTFGFGWTPCVGPWLASLYAQAAHLPIASATALFGIYSLSLGICFIAAGMLFSYALRAFTFLQRHHRAIEIVSGGLLVLIGLLLMTQQWNRATSFLLRFLG